MTSTQLPDDDWTPRRFDPRRKLWHRRIVGYILALLATAVIIVLGLLLKWIF